MNSQKLDTILENRLLQKMDYSKISSPNLIFLIKNETNSADSDN